MATCVIILTSLKIVRANILVTIFITVSYDCILVVLLEEK